MAEERVQRRLAAILAADVVGYSRLMGQDESGTFAALKARRKEVLEPLVSQNRGRIFKVTGDGVLVEFGSAVNAVKCAIELQRDMATANSDLAETHQIVLRVGVNLGDVMVEGSDLYGDGVNIAARLEGIAEPGGILLSKTAFEYVRNKVDAAFEDLGNQTLKNIAEPVRVYRVAGTPQVSAAMPIAATEKPAVAVLPLVNMSGDVEQQYFSDGITEDIITELSRFRSLLVIGRNSSFQFPPTADVKRIGRELGVQYVVEGSVRRSNNRVRITAQLIEAARGDQLWAEHYDRDMHDVFAIQDELAQSIAATIEGRVAASGAQRSRHKPTSDLAAYDYFLQGRESIERRGDPAIAALSLRRAIELDPGFAQAHAWLSQLQLFMFLVELHPESLHEAIVLARKALSLDGADAWSHRAIGYAYMIDGQHEQAGIHLDRAVALNPTDTRITSVHALWLAFAGKGNEAARCLEADLRRDPFPPAWFWNFRAIALFQARRYREAIGALNRLTEPQPWDYYFLAASYAHLGLIDEARACSAEILRSRPGFVLEQVGIVEPFRDPADLEHLLDGLRKAGLPK